MTSTQRKPYGAGADQPPREITRLKSLWLKSISEADKEEWRELLHSEMTNEELRQQLLERLGVKLDYNSQVVAFRLWDDWEHAVELERERQLDDQRRLIEEFGDQWELGDARRELLRRSYERALAVGDFKQGLATAREDLRGEKLALEVRKFEWREKRENTPSNTRVPLTAAEKEAAYRRIFGMAE